MIIVNQRANRITVGHKFVIVRQSGIFLNDLLRILHRNLCCSRFFCIHRIGIGAGIISCDGKPDGNSRADFCVQLQRPRFTV